MRIRIMIYLAILLNGSATMGTEVSPPAVRTVKIYAVSWKHKYQLIRTLHNIKPNFIFYFENISPDLGNMFLNYEDAVEKLSSQAGLEALDSIRGRLINVLAELHFSDGEHISLFFDSDGNYYFQGRWHKINHGLYYLLFRYFSDEIVPNSLLIQSQNKSQDDFWH